MVVAANAEDWPKFMNLSFSGCGFMCVYHVGVCAAIKEFAPQLAQNRISGASAGSIMASALVCDVPIVKAMAIIMKVVTKARTLSLGALHPAFNLVELIRWGLEEALPENAHEMASGRLQISLTRVRDGKNFLVTEFNTRVELIQAIVCSCFIPVLCGVIPPVFRGERFIDGGWSDNQPMIDTHTITVCPFSGESDICPPDWESRRFLFGMELSRTSIRFTTRNLYRLIGFLIPPSTRLCALICRQGFEDTLRFLSRSGLLPCAGCLTVRPSVGERRRSSRYFLKERNMLQTTLPFKRMRANSVCNECANRVETTESPVNATGSVTSQLSELFPTVIQDALNEAMVSDSAMMSISFRFVHYLRVLLDQAFWIMGQGWVATHCILSWTLAIIFPQWARRITSFFVKLLRKEFALVGRLAGSATYLLKFVSKVFDYTKLDDAIIAELYLDHRNKEKHEEQVAPDDVCPVPLPGSNSANKEVTAEDHTGKSDLHHDIVDDLIENVLLREPEEEGEPARHDQTPTSPENAAAKELLNKSEAAPDATLTETRQHQMGECSIHVPKTIPEASFEGNAEAKDPNGRKYSLNGRPITSLIGTADSPDVTLRKRNTTGSDRVDLDFRRRARSGGAHLSRPLSTVSAPGGSLMDDDPDGDPADEVCLLLCSPETGEYVCQLEELSRRGSQSSGN